MNNVRCTICSFETSEAFGIQSLVTGETLLEGYLEEVNDRMIGMLNSPVPSQSMSAQFKFRFIPKQVYLAHEDTYTDFHEDLREGSLLQFTQYRHPKLKIWIDYPAVTTVYLVSSVRDADHLGTAKVATLKEHGV